MFIRHSSYSMTCGQRYAVILFLPLIMSVYCVFYPYVSFFWYYLYVVPLLQHTFTLHSPLNLPLIMCVSFYPYVSLCVLTVCFTCLLTIFVLYLPLILPLIMCVFLPLIMCVFLSPCVFMCIDCMFSSMVHIYFYSPLIPPLTFH